MSWGSGWGEETCWVLSDSKNETVRRTADVADFMDQTVLSAPALSLGIASGLRTKGEFCRTEIVFFPKPQTQNPGSQLCRRENGEPRMTQILRIGDREVLSARNREGSQISIFRFRRRRVVSARIVVLPQTLNPKPQTLCRIELNPRRAWQRIPHPLLRGTSPCFANSKSGTPPRERIKLYRNVLQSATK
jgi:hypothetical protein